MAADGDDSRKATGGWPHNEGALRLDELPSSSRICEETRRDYKGIRGATPTHTERERERERERGREGERAREACSISLSHCFAAPSYRSLLDNLHSVYQPILTPARSVVITGYSLPSFQGAFTPFITRLCLSSSRLFQGLRVLPSWKPKTRPPGQMQCELRRSPQLQPPPLSRGPE
jgi:hypothetical protein